MSPMHTFINALNGTVIENPIKNINVKEGGQVQYKYAGLSTSSTKGLRSIQGVPEYVGNLSELNRPPKNNMTSSYILVFYIRDEP